MLHYKTSNKIKMLDELELLRLSKKWSQKQVAETLGVARSTYIQWFTTKRKPNKIFTFQIEQLLKKERKNEP